MNDALASGIAELAVAAWLAGIAGMAYRAAQRPGADGPAIAVVLAVSLGLAMALFGWGLDAFLRGL